MNDFIKKENIYFIDKNGEKFTWNEASIITPDVIGGYYGKSRIQYKNEQIIVGVSRYKHLAFNNIIIDDGEKKVELQIGKINIANFVTFDGYNLLNDKYDEDEFNEWLLEEKFENNRTNNNKFFVPTQMLLDKLKKNINSEKISGYLKVQSNLSERELFFENLSSILNSKNEFKGKIAISFYDKPKIKESKIISEKEDHIVSVAFSDITNSITNSVINFDKEYSNKKTNLENLNLNESNLINVLDINGVESSNSQIYNCSIIGTKIENSKIKNVDLVSSKLKFVSIETDATIGVSNSNFISTNIKTIGEEAKIIIENSDMYGVKNLEIGNQKNGNLVEIYSSVLANLYNSNIIRGNFYCENSKMEGNVLFFNNYNEKIIINNSLLSGDSIIANNSQISNVKLSGNSNIFNNSKINGTQNAKSRPDEFRGYLDNESGVKISGYTKIFEKANVLGDSKISGVVNIYGESEVSDESVIYGKVNILDDARVQGKSTLYKKEIINKYEERYE